jgi:hypothetical protein
MMGILLNFFIENSFVINAVFSDKARTMCYFIRRHNQSHVDNFAIAVSKKAQIALLRLGQGINGCALQMLLG